MLSQEFVNFCFKSLTISGFSDTAISIFPFIIDNSFIKKSFNCSSKVFNYCVISLIIFSSGFVIGALLLTI
jgi:hypothetical protein